MRRNLCDDCKDCEDNDKSMSYCFDVCGIPLDILDDTERKRNATERDDKEIENTNTTIVYCINIPENATNGEAIKALFPQIVTQEILNGDIILINGIDDCSMVFSREMWNAPYKGDDNNGESN